MIHWPQGFEELWLHGFNSVFPPHLIKIQKFPFLTNSFRIFLPIWHKISIFRAGFHGCSLHDYLWGQSRITEALPHNKWERLEIKGMVNRLKPPRDIRAKIKKRVFTVIFFNGFDGKTDFFSLKIENLLCCIFAFCFVKVKQPHVILRKNLLNLE